MKILKRDKSIDFWRGIACLSVIFIHTVFHSGNSYVPRNISCWSLLFDIPIFMLLAGMTYAKNDKPERKLNEILNLIYKWGIFVIICYIYLLIVDHGVIKFKDIVSWLVFSPITRSSYVVSLTGSLWFMIYYIQASLLSVFLLIFVRHIGQGSYKGVLSKIIAVLFFILVSINCKVNYFGLNSTLIGYVIFFLLGFLAEREVLFKNIRSFVITEILLILGILLLFYVNDYTIANLQDLKMPNMSYLYVLVSFISLFVVIYLKRKSIYDKGFFKPLIYIGRNSFYMYFAQGISSSLLFFISPYITIESCGLMVKIIIMFLINLFLAICIFLLIKLIYKITDALKNKFLNLMLVSVDGTKNK